ncbi:MAG TPA: threonine/serine dehydratase [Candidatus Polarisedimenticolaceae bacterium]|nr:threonine/serine dehydratase [Candidatus Polarisedimenticolaceae bacterium]
MAHSQLGFADVQAAARRIAPHVHRTPVVTCSTLDRELGAQVFFKCENLQKVGAFKARGATNAVLGLSTEAAARGVVAHSSGNHAQALAYAAAIRGIPCTVVMPEGASPVKLEAVRGYGAEIVSCPRAERDAACARLMRERGLTLVHPFEDPAVIAGQGTAALELLEEVPDLDLVLAPIGGGGLLSGTTLAVEGLRPGTPVWGAEPEAADDARRSLELGVRQPGVTDPQTAADGLLTGIGARPFAILQARRTRVVTVGEQEILTAARFLLQRVKLVVEPSGATVLAALRREATAVAGKRIGAILSGGNTDFRWLGS